MARKKRNFFLSPRLNRYRCPRQNTEQHKYEDALQLVDELRTRIGDDQAFAYACSQNLAEILDADVASRIPEREDWSGGCILCALELDHKISFVDQRGIYVGDCGDWGLWSKSHTIGLADGLDSPCAYRYQSHMGNWVLVIELSQMGMWEARKMQELEETYPVHVGFRPGIAYPGEYMGITIYRLSAREETDWQERKALRIAEGVK